MLTGDLGVMAVVAALAVGLVAALWKEFKLVTFDPAYAQTQGLPLGLLDGLLTVMSALAIVVGLQMVGVVLMTAMLIAPAAAARQWVSGLGAMVWLSAAFGVVAGVGGALISAAARGVATGPVVVLIASALVIGSMLLAPQRGLIRQAVRQHRHRLRLRDDRVLATLEEIGREHDDPAYPAGRGMLDTAIGAGSDRALARLEAEGLVRAVTVAPETARRWELTERGREAAARLRGAEV
jgi:manganese/zinc/iron transport system permease protein